MTRAALQPVITWSLTAITLLVVVSSLGQSAPGLGERFLELGVYALLTAFALALSVPLARGELSVAHAIGMMAFLSLEIHVYPAMTVAIFLGGLAGGWVLVYRGSNSDGRKRRSADLREVVYITARVTLSFYAAGRLYAEVLQGPLPLSAPGRENLLALAAPLAAYALIYTSVYFALYVLQLYSEGVPRQETRRKNLLSIAIILLLPVPFSLIAADVGRADESMIYFTIMVIGVVLAISGLYVLSSSQERLRRQVVELQSLSVATGLMRGSLELDSLLRAIYVQISDLLDTQSATLVLRGSVGDEYPLVIRRGEEVVITDARPDDEPLIQHVLTTGKPLLLDDIPTLPLPCEAVSWLGVPLISGQHTMGAIAVLSYDDGRFFTENDLRLLNIVASSASIAIENARLYTEKSYRAEQLATLNKIAALLTGTLSPGEVLDTIVSSASTISDAVAIAVYLYSQDNPPVLKLVRSAGLSTTFVADAPGLLSGSYVPGIKPPPVVIPNVKTDERAAAIRQRLLVEGMRALAELPLVVGEMTPGVMVLYFATEQPTLPEQMDLLQAFATQAAQAIKNARAYDTADKALEQRIEQLYVLAAMGRILNATMDIQQIYEVILGQAQETTRAARGAIALYDMSRRLSVVAQQGYDPEVLRDPSVLESGLTGQVLSSGQPVRTEDVRVETGHLPLMPKTRSLLVTPITTRGREVQGIIVLESDEVAAFSESDGHFIAQIAYQAVIAVDNTRLFQSVRAARDNLQVILNTMEEGILLINAQGEIALANPRMDLIGLRPETILGRPVNALMADDTLKFALRTGLNSDLLHTLLEDIRTSETWGNYPNYAYEVHDDTYGVRYILRQIIPLREESQQVMGALLVFYNKTDERELQRSREAFTQMIVHDLRSPLTAVTTSLKLLRELVPEDRDYKPLVEKATEVSRRAIRKVLTRVDSLLDIARMESHEVYLEREPVELTTLIEAVRTELDPLAQELDIAIITELANGLPPLYVDSDKVERMLLNLLDNALKYSPQESMVIIQAQMTEDNGMMRMAVIDRGPGVPPEHRQRLFERFFQVEGRQVVRRGVGLGLAFCKLVVTAHGGSIWIEDNQPQGSRFMVTLPVLKIGQPAE